MDSRLTGTASDAIQQFLNEDQDEATVQKVLSKVSDILTRGEEIRYIAVQQRPLHMNFAPESIVLTNKRFIRYKPKMLGGADFQDHIWRDLGEATMSEGLTGATLSLTTVEGTKLKVDYLPKAQARKLYRVAQEMEEEMRDSRRVRELEEARAAAGGITMQSATAPQPSVPATQPVDDPVERLKKLKAMLAAGLIEQDEFDAKKAEILANL
jgi:hypothetical protein